MHHSGKIWTQETEDAFFHTLSGQLTGSVVSSGFIIGSLLEQEGLESILTWMVGAKSNVLPVNARHAVNHDIF